ncbi:MAG: prolyl oligopeptidase family serine peptidase [Pseudomonadota bacterium]
MRKGLISVFAGLTALVLAAPSLAQEGYRLPPQEIVDIVDAPRAPATTLSPDRRHLLLLHRESLPPIADMARPMERLAGLRLDVATNGRHGPRSVVGLSVIDLATGQERRIETPDDAGLSSFNWSPDGSKAAFLVTGENSIGLWVADMARAEASPVIEAGVNAVFNAIDWMPDGEQLLVRTIPADRGAMPQRPRVPAGPVIQEASGYEAPVRTYQDLLEDDIDAALFAWLAATQLVLVNAEGGDPRPVGEPGLYYSADPAPGGRYVLAERFETPFSFVVPWSRFRQTSVVLDLEGREVAEIAQRPLGDAIPIGGVIDARRAVGWQASHPARLIWAEALDGGDPRVETDERDSLWALAAPFNGEPTEIARFEDRYFGTMFTAAGETGLAVEYDRDTRVLRRWLIDFAEDGAAPRLAEERNLQDSYADPGEPLMVRNRFGRAVAGVYDGHMFMDGDGATPEGDRPFLSRLSLETFESEILWRNSGENYERVIGLVEADGSAFLTSYEDPATPPNVRLHRGEAISPVTEFANPHPQLDAISRELITYEREDGVPLSATLYLPAGFTPGDPPPPLLVWAYPREFNDAATAGQVRGSPYRFTRIAGTSPRFMVTQGYALLENATMPIVGDDPETVNDSFIEQLVLSAEAAIDEAVARGASDGERVGIAGHSYGAFMTAHLLAASDLFRAGIARSGAYNRTLTPFGFQAERRTFWAAPDVYFRLSPFMHADDIDEPVLMIHGQVDNNSGTFPMQSERMFAAIKGNAGTARLVMLPHESHGYRARESVLHVLAESIDWLDAYVKPEEPVIERAPAGEDAGADSAIE